MSSFRGERLDALGADYAVLSCCRRSVEAACQELIDCFRRGGKVMACGNGGSALDAEHIVGELMKGFRRKRPLPTEIRGRLAESGGEEGGFLAERLQQPLCAMSLNGHPALTTAVANDIDATVVFAQQLIGFGREGDVLIGLSTSGSSRNVCYAGIVARALGMRSIGLTGETSCRMDDLFDTVIKTPSSITHRVQEYHLAIYHAMCEIVEAEFFPQ